MPNDAEILARIESDADVASALDWPFDVDIARRDPEPLRLSSGLALTPIAGDGTGGTYFLCGDPSDTPRSVLWVGSEGEATLLGRDLAEAVRLVVALPFWRDVAAGMDPAELRAELDDEEPEWEAQGAAILSALGLVAISTDEAVAHLESELARTSEGYVPIAEDGSQYDVIGRG